VCSFLYVSIPLSISIASTIRVGRLLGAQNHAAAKTSSFLAVGISTVFMGAAGLILYRLRGVIGYLFTSDLDIIYRLKMLIPVVASFQVVNGVQGAAQGVMRGMCRHTEVFGYSFLSYWVLGFPLGIYLAFFTRPRNGLYGLWYGFLAGVGLLGCLMMFIIVTTNWEREVRRARVRAEKYQNSFDTVQASPHPGSRALGGFLLLNPGGDEELDDLERIEITLYEEDMKRAERVNDEEENDRL
jgi:multidrug resistance protein, MATE family